MKIQTRVLLVVGLAAVMFLGVRATRDRHAAGSVAVTTSPRASVNPTPVVPASPGNPPAHVPPAPALTPGTDRRAWDYQFFAGLTNAAPGGAIEFELIGGERARGVIRHLERVHGQVTVVAGDVTSPEAGRFSFRQQTLPGKAGDFSGEVTFPGSQRAFRIEPTGPGGTSELVARRLDEVLCLTMPALDAAQLAALDAEEIPPLNPSGVPDYVPAYNDGLISLQSLPGVTAVLYLDYRGGYTPTWGGITYAKPNVSNAQVKDVWQRVAEDFMPFNINVTTDIRVYEAAPENSRQRCVLTPTTTAAPGAGGVAYVGDWNNTGDRPCWSFYSTGKSAAEVVSHEIGHTLGLSHDGRTTPVEGYFGGHGSGSVGWAPIMGVGYYQPVAQWSKGEYANANQTQNDLAIIVNNNNAVDYRTDDTGATLGAARYLEVYSDFTASAEGVVETTGDTDAFRFTTTGGTVTLAANVVGDWSDLAIMATLADDTDTLIASNNPQTVLTASLSTNLAAGTYTFRVTGTGRNDPLTDGFSAYASLGYYSVTGSVAGAVVPSRFSIAENSPNGTSVGTITATNLGVDPLDFVIVSGNSANTFALDSNGTLTVSNSGALNYEVLALQNSFPVQYELFVNITNQVNPALTELNRRVVVQVINVNEAPAITAFTNLLIAHTQPGTPVGNVAASDPDFYSVLTLSLVSGNSNGAFALDPGTGRLTVAGDLDPGVQSSYQLAVRVVDNGAPALSATNHVQLTIITNTSPFLPGTVSYAAYDGIGSGVYVSNLTSNTRFPLDPTWEKQIATAEGDSDRADNYGSVLRGYLIPPVSGTYTFFVATDDNGELWLSTTTNPASMTRIAEVAGANNWAAPRQWNKFASQTSTSRTLVAGQAYYIEARQKEGGGGDNLAVGWKGPATANLTNVIPALFLAPYPMNYVPHATGFAANVRRDAFQNAAIGQLTVTDVNANDTHSFTLLSGNTGGVFAVDSNGWVRVASDTALQSSGPTNFTLSIRIADNGAPSLAATTSVSLTLVSSDVLAVTSLQREMFYSLGSATTVASLTGNAKYPGKPDAIIAFTSLNTAEDVADNYGSRTRGFVVPSVSGDYQFFIASDDNSQLKFSYTTNAAAATVIASVSTGAGWAGVNEWNKLSGQASPLITNLVAGQRYYLEVLHKEGGGGDHFEVGWLVPGSGVTNIIPAANLQPVDINHAPQFSTALAPVIFADATNGQALATVAASDSPLDALTYKIVSGNSNSTFTIDPATGVLTVADNTAITDGSVTTFPLGIAAQDSGYGGLYPLKSAPTTVTVRVVNPGTALWTGGGTANLWSQSNNWGGPPITAGARAIFGVATRQANTNDAVNALDSVQFTTGGFSAAGAALTLQSGLTNNGNTTWAIGTRLGAAQTWRSVSGTLTVSGAVTNGGNALTIAADGAVSLSGALAGPGALIKSGAGTLTLSGANTNTGGVTVNEGTVLLNHVNAIPYGGARSNLTIAAGATVIWNNTGNTGNGTGNSGWNQNLLGAGTFAVSNASTSLTLSGNNTFSGTWRAEAATAFVFGNAAASQGAANLVINGGSVLLGFNGTTTVGNLSGTGGNVAVNYNYAGAGNGLRTLSVNQTADATYAGVLGVGDGGSGLRQMALVKSGPAVLTLTGANGFSGPTILSGGTLRVNGSLGTNTVTVQSSATLGGSGVITGAVVVASGGTLAPGVSGIGRLTALRNFNLAGTALMEISTSSGLTNDLLSTATALKYGGTLTVTNLGGGPLNLGNSFKLFNAASYTGSFSATNLPSLAPGLVWSWSSTSGTLTVVPAVNSTPTNMTAVVSGDRLTLTWPTDQTGWTLQTQTNALGAGLNPGLWYPVAGSTATNSVTVTIDPAQPTVYYRLSFP